MCIFDTMVALITDYWIYMLSVETNCARLPLSNLLASPFHTPRNPHGANTCRHLIPNERKNSAVTHERVPAHNDAVVLYYVCWIVKQVTAEWEYASSANLARLNTHTH